MVGRYVTPRAARRRNRLRRWVWALIDAVIWVIAIYGATWLRFDFDRRPVLVSGTGLFAIAAACATILIGALIGPYGVGHQRGSFEETIDVGRNAVLVTAGLFIWALIAHPIIVPRSIPVMAGTLAMTGMFATRFIIRAWTTRRAAGKNREQRVIIFGAGEAGRRLLRSMVRDEGSSFTPVALLDDDKTRARLRVEGVRVRGNRSHMVKVAEKYGATALVIALPLATASTIRALTEIAAAAGLDVLTLPPLREIMGGRPTENDLRDVDLADLLGRRPISLDTTVIAEQISGRTVLVTGAGGTIGSELCRQIVRFGPAKLYMLDRDESGLQATQLSVNGNGLLDNDETILADIRDPATMRTVFRITQPDIVFHAAALKHLPLLESYPLEAWKSNVVGTLNVLTAAAEVGVGTFVNISTDKAANPTCVLGYSKRIAERLTADFARNQSGRYMSVRFGNVLGSRGSVVPAFAAQIERGGPITVTHPDVERFFMLIPEACQLVLEAGSIGADGELMVLDMGEQVKIVDVANTLIRLSGRHDIDIIFTGLRPGEKLAEDLFSLNEDRRATSNPLVTSVDIPSLDSSQVRQMTIPTHEMAFSWMKLESSNQFSDISVLASD
jgi:FlaA1/EpsC-like NDP-sugar epimerase